MDLHYSQTSQQSLRKNGKFESPMDLHYSQTTSRGIRRLLVFESPMDLHYSQTTVPFPIWDESLNPLWIYTTLKHG